MKRRQRCTGFREFAIKSVSGSLKSTQPFQSSLNIAPHYTKTHQAVDNFANAPIEAA